MKMSYDATGLDPTADFPVAPEGKYTLSIKEVYDTDKEGNQKRTKNGDPMVSVKCEIDDAQSPYFGTTIFHNVTFMPKEKRGSGMAILFLKAIGEPYKDNFGIDTDRWIGKQFRAKVGIGKDLQGRKRNEIAYLIDPLEPEATDDDIPF